MNWKTEYLKKQVEQSNKADLTLKATKFYGRYFYKINKEMMLLKKLSSVKSGRYTPLTVIELIATMGDECGISVSRDYHLHQTFCITKYFSKKFGVDVSIYEIQREMDSLFQRDSNRVIFTIVAACFITYIFLLLIFVDI